MQVFTILLSALATTAIAAPSEALQSNDMASLKVRALDAYKRGTFEEFKNEHLAPRISQVSKRQIWAPSPEGCESTESWDLCTISNPAICLIPHAAPASACRLKCEPCCDWEQSHAGLCQI